MSVVEGSLCCHNSVSQSAQKQKNYKERESEIQGKQITGNINMFNGIETEGLKVKVKKIIDF